MYTQAGMGRQATIMRPYIMDVHYTHTVIQLQEWPPRGEVNEMETL